MFKSELAKKFIAALLCVEKKSSAGLGKISVAQESPSSFDFCPVHFANAE